MTAGTVLITGASSGIGMAVAKLLSEEGFRVFGTSRRPESVQISGVAGILPLDVRSDASVRAVFRLLADQGHCVDILINNAGYVMTGALAVC